MPSLEESSAENESDVNVFAEFALGQELPPQPRQNETFCAQDSRLDFTGKDPAVLQSVFWVSAIICVCNLVFLIFMIVHSCQRTNKERSTLTKCQFFLLYFTVSITLVQVGVYTFA